MSRIRQGHLLSLSALVLVVAVGYVAGANMERADWRSSLVGLASLAGVMVAILSCPFTTTTAWDLLGLGGLMAYIVAAAAVEPFGFLYDSRGVIVSVAWLVPLLIGAIELPRHRAWLISVGYWGLILHVTSALSYNVHHIHTGIGFVGSWAD